MPLDISFSSNPTNSVSKTYIDQNYVNTEGDTLQGDLDINSNKIINPSEISFHGSNSKIYHVLDNDIDGLVIQNNATCLFKDNDNIKLAILNNAVDLFGNKLINTGEITFGHCNSKIFHNSETDEDGLIIQNKKSCVFKDKRNNVNMSILNDTIDVNNNTISNLGTPTSNTDAVNKQYVDSIFQSDINLNNHKITNLSYPTNDSDAANKEYVDLEVYGSRETLTTLLVDKTNRFKPQIYTNLITSSNEHIIEISRPSWFAVMITVKMFSGFKNCFILRTQANEDFILTHKGEGLPGTYNYNINYYGKVKISYVNDNQLTLSAFNFGYTVDRNPGYFITRDNHRNYGIVSCVIFNQ